MNTNVVSAISSVAHPYIVGGLMIIMALAEHFGIDLPGITANDVGATFFGGLGLITGAMKSRADAKKANTGELKT